MGLHQRRSHVVDYAIKFCTLPLLAAFPLELPSVPDSLISFAIKIIICLRGSKLLSTRNRLHSLSSPLGAPPFIHTSLHPLLNPLLLRRKPWNCEEQGSLLRSDSAVHRKRGAQFGHFIPARLAHRWRRGRWWVIQPLPVLHQSQIFGWSSPCLQCLSRICPPLLKSSVWWLLLFLNPLSHRLSLLLWILVTQISCLLFGSQGGF